MDHLSCATAQTVYVTVTAIALGLSVLVGGCWLAIFLADALTRRFR